jgi:DNA helicase-2/ATP-dependent DNA helicase PcrA
MQYDMLQSTSHSQQKNTTNHDLDLSAIARILLKPGQTFDDRTGERKMFIFSNDRSFDMVACAGSGKTTCLLAKLLLLEKQLPFDGGKGICVLTHTNIALDEIKDKIGSGNKLFVHPNFFGTIQQFVNKFLAIPAYQCMFKRQPFVIDSDFYLGKLKNFQLLSLTTKKRFYGLAKYSNRSAEDIYKNILFDFVHEKYTDGLYGKPIYVDKTNSGYVEIDALKKNILKEGILSFDDAYRLAQWYLDKYLFVRSIIRERFKYVFIDEMQDTAIHQLEILDTLFPAGKVIIQRIGDPNQAIYNFEKNKNPWIPRDGYLTLTGSLRFSQMICNVVRGVRYDCTDGLESICEGVASIAPYLILYKEGEERKVIPYFLEVLEKHKSALQIEEKDKIRVIGWNGKVKEEKGNNDNIQKYFGKYSKAAQNKTRYFRNLKSYLLLSTQASYKSNNAKHYKDLIIEIISRFLFEQGILINGQNPSTSRVLKYFEENKRFQDSIFVFSINIKMGLDIEKPLKQYFQTELLAFFEHTTLSNEAVLFLENRNEEKHNLVIGQENNSNVCGEFCGIPIKVSTIHGVKGETHKATLYLETKYYSFDLEEIINHLTGNKMKGGKELGEQRQKMVYVGMSRASHLLCIALRNSAVDNTKLKKLYDMGFKIENI